ncbi:hypothetical protein BJ508DRAFT_332166 [Ascobolus immersus RN42]|uniref:Winged helix DNA-binding domain-containing protein n=1 Tax=Ascobolus immersus RN42 TaxID=1160509 RepID=A0A3N4HU73_ASCIM|nr:hypothetical protein BJ508DRAFT_332166 [Ascobolus immersus RN42]
MALPRHPDDALLSTYFFPLRELWERSHQIRAELLGDEDEEEEEVGVELGIMPTQLYSAPLSPGTSSAPPPAPSPSSPPASAHPIITTSFTPINIPNLASSNSTNPANPTTSVSTNSTGHNSSTAHHSGPAPRRRNLSRGQYRVMNEQIFGALDESPRTISALFEELSDTLPLAIRRHYNALQSNSLYRRIEDVVVKGCSQKGWMEKTGELVNGACVYRLTDEGRTFLASLTEE